MIPTRLTVKGRTAEEAQRKLRKLAHEMELQGIFSLEEE